MMGRLTAYRRPLAIGIGFALDALLGDPRGWPHPVRVLGKQIELEEKLVREHVLPQAEEAEDAWPLDRRQTERLAGAAVTADVVLLAPLATAGTLALISRAHPIAALALESALCYQLLAARSLQDESMPVYDALKAHDLRAARSAVSMIVGRDTDALDEQEVARAAVETVAENASDGIIAPLFYMAFGGAPAALAYKAANTLDSMIGYKNERYLDFGRTAAKLDDVLNFVPSRLAGVLMCAAARICGYDARRAWRTFKRDRLNHASPNSGHTEAACAGALGIQLGGGNYYFGTYVDKPTIGDATRDVEPEDIPRANRLMRTTALLGLGAALTATSALSRLNKVRGHGR